jgi:hypothetical protein
MNAIPEPRSTPDAIAPERGDAGDGASRVLYFITSYGTGAQLQRLLRTLLTGDPDCAVVIHHDRFQADLDLGDLADHDDVHVLTSDEPIVWGDLSLEQARWRVFEWSLRHMEFGWMVLLSEQDYPLVPIRDVTDGLRRCGADALIEAVPIEQIDDPHHLRELRPHHRLDCRRRYEYRYQVVPRLGLTDGWPDQARTASRHLRRALYFTVNAVQKKVVLYSFHDKLGMGTKVGVRSTRPPFDANFPCWYSSAWFALSRRAVRSVVAFVTENEDFVEHYEDTIIPVESATATIVCNDPGLRVARRSLHYVRWSDRGSGRPDVLTAHDAGELLRSGFYFARKLDLVTEPELFDILDRTVLAEPMAEKAVEHASADSGG